MTERKTIQINPELFKLNNNFDKKKNKTIKNKPLISLNSLKNKFLNKIKENKNNEIKLSPFLNKKYEKKKIDDIKIKSNNDNNNSNDIEKDSSKDEFTESLEYLKKLSEKNKQIPNNSLINTNNKTLKNNVSVNIELPVELKEKNSFVFQTNNDKNKSSKIKYKVDNDVPFGCLKNGIKPCFRKWKTLKNSPLIYENEDKLKIINKKINNNLIQQQEVFQELNQQQPAYHQLYQQQQYNQPLHQEQFQQQSPEPMFEESSQQSLYQKPILNKIEENKEDFIIEKLEEPEEVKKPEEIIKKDINVPVKQTIKKTTYKKYTLGKNNLKRKVGVLIKNNKTRKNIMEQHKLLKVKPIPEVKKYLREHNLIKSGSYCPNDVLRKMYESAILTGEVINIDKDMMIHNIINNEDKL
jgi:hypothetical protein